MRTRGSRGDGQVLRQLLLQRLHCDTENERRLLVIARREGERLEGDLALGVLEGRADRNVYFALLERQMPWQQIRHLDLVGLGEDHGALDGVLELADVTGPAIRREILDRPLAEAPDLLVLLLREATQELLRQHAHVAVTLAQRRQIHRDDSETMIEILAQLSFL